MTWEDQYRLYQEDGISRGEGRDEPLPEARDLIAQNTPEDWQWLISSLEDNQRKWFVAEVFRFEQLPERLFFPMLRAGVLERDPSDNRKFIDPCLRSYSARRVCAALLEYLETGSNQEKAGAASALYWAWRPKPGEDMSELAARMHIDMLREFVYNDDLQVRRRIIPHIDLEPTDYPEDLRALVQSAISIARAHPDKYIRHRVEIQLGAGGPYMAMPDTEQ